MTSQACQTLRLTEYVDGELSGADRLAVSRHLEGCRECEARATSFLQVGEWLRGAAADRPLPSELDGLAGGVISRIGAERAQSWRALLLRGFEDWHWFLVGFGSVTAAFLSIAFVGAILQFGPAPERQDSVSALLSNSDWKVVNSPDGSLYVWAKPLPDTMDWKIMLSGREREAARNVPASLAGIRSSEALAGALDDALGRSGQQIDMRTVDASTRRDAEVLFSSLKRLQTESRVSNSDGDRAGSSSRNVEHYRMQFVTNTEVTAKGW